MISLCGLYPLQEVLWAVLHHTRFRETPLQTLGKHYHNRGVVEIYAGLVCQVLERGNVLIQSPFTHSQLLDILCCLIRCSIICERITEFSLHDLPRVISEGWPIYSFINS